VKGEQLMKKDKVDEALEKMAESLQRLEESGDIDGFVVITQKKMSQTTDGVAAICEASDRQLVVWAAALAQAVARRGHHSPQRIAQDLYNVITSWKTYEEGYTQEDWEGERDDRVH
jgi:hypothetical protein